MLVPRHSGFHSLESHIIEELVRIFGIGPIPTMILVTESQKKVLLILLVTAVAIFPLIRKSTKSEYILLISNLEVSNNYVPIRWRRWRAAVQFESSVTSSMNSRKVSQTNAPCTLLSVLPKSVNVC